MKEMEEALRNRILHCLQLERIIWLLADSLPDKALTVDLRQTNPLWTLKFSNPDASLPHFVRFTAAILPDPTPEQLDALAALLMGTSTAIENVQDKVDLPVHPSPYLHEKLSSRITLEKGIWIATPAATPANDPAPATTASSPTG